MDIRYSLNKQTFSILIEEERIYVDKTKLIYELVKQGGGTAYFLSRPRRFGKSLLISTLKSIFEGQQHLFKDLWIYDKITWTVFPVIHLSMDRMNFIALGLEYTLAELLKSVAQDYGIALSKSDSKGLFEELIKALYDKFGQQVVILIDEYDAPITQYLEKSDFDKAEANRDILKNFYGVLKPSDPYVRFLFITGITKFTRVSIFSELNHPIDITLHKHFTTLLGYTQAELMQYFSEGIAKLAAENNFTQDACLAKIKDWYNGFSWDGRNFVYNPFSFLRLVESSQFSNYWFESGTPSFLIEMLKKVEAFELENIRANEEIYNSYDFRKLNYKTLMLQTGYLTIKEKIEDFILLDFPNKEVKEAFNAMLLGSYVEQHLAEAKMIIFDVKEAFLRRDIEQVMHIIKQLFESIPYELFTKKDRFGQEKPVGENFYHAIIYLVFNILGVKMKSEVMVKGGRIDAEVETDEHIYLFEFKKDNDPDTAIAQMEINRYAKKYRLLHKKIHLIGASFSLEKRGLDDWKMKEL